MAATGDPSAAGGYKPGPGAATEGKAIESLTRKNIEVLLRLERERHARRPRAYRVAASIAGFCGTAPILWIHALFFAAWILFNTTALAFDPYPFTFLTLVVSLEAIFLSTFIMIGQNISNRESERRHHLDLQINLLNEREMTAMLRLMTRIAEKLDISEADQAEVRKFAHNTDPRAVLDQIVTAEHAGRHEQAAAPKPAPHDRDHPHAAAQPTFANHLHPLLQDKP